MAYFKALLILAALVAALSSAVSAEHIEHVVKNMESVSGDSSNMHHADVATRQAFYGKVGGSGSKSGSKSGSGSKGTKPKY